MNPPPFLIIFWKVVGLGVYSSCKSSLEQKHIFEFKNEFYLLTFMEFSGVLVKERGKTCKNIL